MFRSRRRDVVFPQADHAAFAGGIALLWGNGDFARPPLPFDSFVRAVALHDRGYGELDTAEIGAVEPEVWLRLQEAGFGVRDDDPVVDVVASMHIRRLVSWWDEPRIVAAHAVMTEALPALLERADVSEERVLAADAITNLCDRISFDVCCEERADGGVEIDGHRIVYMFDGARTVSVSPWPFAPDEGSLLLVGYRADGYPERLQRIVEPITLEPG